MPKDPEPKDSVLDNPLYKIAASGLETANDMPIISEILGAGVYGSTMLTEASGDVSLRWQDENAEGMKDFAFGSDLPKSRFTPTSLSNADEKDFRSIKDKVVLNISDNIEFSEKFGEIPQKIKESEDALDASIKIQNMLADGEISPDEADYYMDQLNNVTNNEVAKKLSSMEEGDIITDEEVLDKFDVRGTHQSGFSLGDFTKSIGKDESGYYFSLYDKYDFGPQYGDKYTGGSKVGKVAAGLLDKAGHPFHIYDRFYFDPETGEQVRPKISKESYERSKENINLHDKDISTKRDKTMTRGNRALNPPLPKLELASGGYNWPPTKGGGGSSGGGSPPPTGGGGFGGGSYYDWASLGANLFSSAAPLFGGGRMGGMPMRGLSRGMGVQRALQTTLPRLNSSNNSANQGTTTEIIAGGGYIENKMRNGGTVPIGQDAEKVVGPRHENGGVHLNERTEVEGGETLDNLSKGEYVFSDRLTVPNSVLPDGKQGMTFADYHKHLVENNANQSQIQELAEIQERVAGRDQSGSTITGENKTQDEPNKRTKHLGPLGKKLAMLGNEKKMPAGGKMPNVYEEGGYYAVKASETEGDEPKYPINSADDVKDAWKLRNHGDYNISQSTLEERIKRKANEYGVDLGEDEKAYGGEVEYQTGGYYGDKWENRTGQGAMAAGVDTGYNRGDTGIDWGETANSVVGGIGNVLESALPYAPAILNLGRAGISALKGGPDVSDVPYTPPAGRAEETIRQMETDVNVDPQLASVDRALRSVIADPTASQNQKRAAATNAMKQRAKIEAQEENRETRLRNQMLSKLASAQQGRDRAISQGRTQAAQAERRQQMKADEAQMNLITTGLQQASQRLQQQQRWQDKLDMDAVSLAAELSAVENQAAVDRVFEMLQERYPQKAQRVRQIYNKE